MADTNDEKINDSQKPTEPTQTSCAVQAFSSSANVNANSSCLCHKVEKEVWIIQRAVSQCCRGTNKLSGLSHSSLYTVFRPALDEAPPPESLLPSRGCPGPLLL